MTILGIDFGSCTSVVATVQKGAVVVIRNELSERLTPTLIAFGPSKRTMGEESQSQVKSNFKNTCRYFKQLMGVMGGQEVIASEQKFSYCPIGVDPSTGLAGYNVECETEFPGNCCNTISCMAGYLTSLKETTERVTSSTVTDIVISVPVWADERFRQAMFNASQIAGIRCLRLMNEHAATALDYGIFRMTSFDATKPVKVGFVDIGHCNSTISIVNFTKSELTVLSVVSSSNLGGRDIEWSIVEHLNSLFKQQHGIDLLTNKKSTFKLEDAAIKAKKVLSANKEAAICIECVYEELDINVNLSRQDLEVLCAPLKTRLTELLVASFSSHEMSSFSGIELVGGCTRVPWVQEVISSVLKFDTLSRTLQMDETVARGCALQAAMIHPSIRVKEFKVNDITLMPATIWYPNGNRAKLFSEGAKLNRLNKVTFTNNSPLSLKIQHGEGVPTVAHISPPTEFTGAFKEIQVTSRLTYDSILMFESANIITQEEIPPPPSPPPASQPTCDTNVESTDGVPLGYEDSKPSPTSPPSPPGATAPSPAAAVVEEDRKAKKFREKSFPCKLELEGRSGFLSLDSVQELHKIENNMRITDGKARELSNLQNELESSIYKYREVMSGNLEPYIDPNCKGSLEVLLENAENWVYESSTNPADYQDQISSIKEAFRKIEHRSVEVPGRISAVEYYNSVIDKLKERINNEDWSHVQNMSTLTSKLVDGNAWLCSIREEMSRAKLYEDYKISAQYILDEAEALNNFSKVVLVPKPPTPPEQQQEQEEEAQQQPSTKADEALVPPQDEGTPDVNMD